MLEAVEGLGGLGEHQDAGGVPVQAVGDEQLEALEARRAVVVGDGLGQAGVVVLFRRHGEQARGLVHEQKVLVLPEDLERGVAGTAGGEHGVDPVRVEGHRQRVPVLEPQAVAPGRLAVDRDAPGVDQPLGLAVAHLQVGMQLGGKGGAGAPAGQVSFVRAMLPPLPGVLGNAERSSRRPSSSGIPKGFPKPRENQTQPPRRPATAMAAPARAQAAAVQPTPLSRRGAGGAATEPDPPGSWAGRPRTQAGQQDPPARAPGQAGRGPHRAGKRPGEGPPPRPGAGPAGVHGRWRCPG